MYDIILALILIAATIAAPRFPFLFLNSPAIISGVRVVLALFAVALILETSIIRTGLNEVGIAHKLYGSKNLPNGHIIATNGETGAQAEIIPPGTFRVSLFYNLINDLIKVPVVTIPNGFYGRIVARDGENLREGQIMADAWPEPDFAKYLDAQYFMTHGGQKGLQLSVLKPGTYPLNTALFEIKVGYKPNGKDILTTRDDVWDIHGYHKEETPLDTSITVVPAGFVGVVRSSIQERNVDCMAIKAKADNAHNSDSLTADLVPQGCRGVWQYALPPNDYYLNRDAYDVTLMDIKVQALELAGGFNRRYIDLKVDSKGDFTQSEHSTKFTVPEGAVDTAVFTKAEGWEVPQELRAVIQISPEHAPIIVAAVGGLKQVETRVMIPSIRSHVRNVFGGSLTVMEPATEPVPGPDGKPLKNPDGTVQTTVSKNPDGSTKMVSVTRPTRVLDTIGHRTALEDEILKRVQIDGRRAGVDVKEIRLGESAIPPELLLARQREQLAEQLKRAFIQEQRAQEQRQQTEQARATADQQSTLVTAQINAQASRLKVDQRTNEGVAEQRYLESIAAGQKAQTEVLGQDRVTTLKALEMVLDRPQVVQTLAGIKLPGTMVINGGSLDTVGALLGATKLFGGNAQTGK